MEAFYGLARIAFFVQFEDGLENVGIYIDVPSYRALFRASGDDATTKRPCWGHTVPRSEFLLSASATCCAI